VFVLSGVIVALARSTITEYPYFQGFIIKEYVVNIKMLKAAVAGLVLSVSGFANAGLITLDGSIDDGTEVDHWSFFVTTSGSFTFDVLAREISNDFFANGVGNDELDSYIYLFANDANGIFIKKDDDGGAGNDGSIHSHDSFMTVNLNVGTYLLAIGDFSLSELEARNGLNADNAGSAVGRYSVSISSAAGVARVNSVPEPSTIAIFALGIMGLAARRFKKQ